MILIMAVGRANIKMKISRFDRPPSCSWLDSLPILALHIIIICQIAALIPMGRTHTHIYI